jgi:hypothetical protein
MENGMGKWADFYFGDSIWSTTEFSKGCQSAVGGRENSQPRHPIAGKRASGVKTASGEITG